MVDSYDWEVLWIKQEICFSDEDNASPPRIDQQHQAPDVKKEPGPDPAPPKHPNLMVRFFQPPKRGRKPRIPWTTVAEENEATFGQACLGALSGHKREVRKKEHAIANFFFSKSGGIHGGCCYPEVRRTWGTDVTVYRQHLVGLPEALRGYLVRCGRCQKNIWQIGCPAKCLDCNPVLVAHEAQINKGHVYNVNRGRYHRTKPKQHRPRVRVSTWADVLLTLGTGKIVQRKELRYRSLATRRSPTFPRRPRPVVRTSGARTWRVTTSSLCFVNVTFPDVNEGTFLKILRPHRSILTKNSFQDHAATHTHWACSPRMIERMLRYLLGCISRSASCYNSKKLQSVTGISNHWPTHRTRVTLQRHQR
ncbi:unnamed protein product [Trichogramma brassicae]|uniref:Uncharacterized protein n=1 Tax=Trichogramma brassicae TaxID=86971 RepID=A0A6H5IBB8_9HYME|nr:unnamed protein product [Trichogramma brassicae]